MLRKSRCVFRKLKKLVCMKKIYVIDVKIDILFMKAGMRCFLQQQQQQYACMYVVVVFTLTDRASTIPSNIRGCQSGTWSQRGTKVNGSHHVDNPLLRLTGIQIATKSYATLQAMAPTNSKTVHQTSFTPYREQPRSTRIVVAYLCMVITYSRVWINRVRLPILLVVSWTGKIIFPCPRACLRIWSRETGSAVGPVPRQPAHLHTQAESGAYLRESSRVPRRRPL